MRMCPLIGLGLLGAIALMGQVSLASQEEPPMIIGWSSQLSLFRRGLTPNDLGRGIPYTGKPLKKRRGLTKPQLHYYPVRTQLAISVKRRKENRVKFPTSDRRTFWGGYVRVPCQLKYVLARIVRNQVEVDAYFFQQGCHFPDFLAPKDPTKNRYIQMVNRKEDQTDILLINRSPLSVKIYELLSAPPPRYVPPPDYVGPREPEPDALQDDEGPFGFGDEDDYQFSV